MSKRLPTVARQWAGVGADQKALGEWWRKVAENGAQLTPAQARAISCLLTSRNIREAATVAKVAERTLTRWLTEPAFVAALRAAEGAMLDAATRRLLTMQDGALDTLQGLLSDVEVDDGVRLRAALGILAHVLKLRELRDVEERLTALEETYAQK